MSSHCSHNSPILAIPPESNQGSADQQSSLPQRDELRIRWSTTHLCLKCHHHFVCRMNLSLDANLLVAISQCLAFELAYLGDAELAAQGALLTGPA